MPGAKAAARRSNLFCTPKVILTSEKDKAGPRCNFEHRQNDAELRESLVAPGAIAGTAPVRCDVAAPAITRSKLLRKCDFHWATTLDSVMKVVLAAESGHHC